MLVGICSTSETSAIVRYLPPSLLCIHLPFLVGATRSVSTLFLCLSTKVVWV